MTKKSVEKRTRAQVDFSSYVLVFSGLDDFQTVVVACLLTLIPLILLAVLAIAIR